jgi:DNA-binding transcriptional LysR family regulator
MISGSLTFEEMRLLAAINEVFNENHGKSMSLDELGEALKTRGFKVGKGMVRVIDDLEFKLGGKSAVRKMLLSRKKNGSQMTSAGRQMHQQVRGVLASFDELQLTVDSGRSLVRIGLTNTLATNLFPRVLTETSFFKAFPKVDLEIVEGEPHELVGMLQSRVDFAVGPKDVNNGFESRPLCEWKRVLLYSRNVKYHHDFSMTASVETIREWIREENLMIPAPLIIPKLSQFLRPMSSGRIIIVPQAAVRRLWVERGLGIAVSYEEKRRLSSPTDSIGTIDLSKVLGTTEMHLYQRSDAELSEAAAFLVEAVTTIFKRELTDELSGRTI